MTRSARFVSALLALPFVLAACDSGDPEPDEIRRAFLTAVEIEDAPLTNPDGDGWDGGLGGGPDLYFILFGNNNVVLLNAEEELTTPDGGRNYPDVGPQDFSLDWPISPPFEVNDLDRTLVFEVKDDDPTTTDDVVGRTEAFRLRDFVEDGRDRSFVVASDDDGISIRVRVEFDT